MKGYRTWKDRRKANKEEDRQARQREWNRYAESQQQIISDNIDRLEEELKIKQIRTMVNSTTYCSTCGKGDKDGNKKETS